MTDELEKVIQALERAGVKLRRSGDGYCGRCPTHDDHDPSLTVADGREGVVLKCHSPHGCTTEGIMAKIGLPMTALFPPVKEHSRQVAEYIYLDETGERLHRKVRMEPKRFYQGAWNGTGWNKSLGDVRRVLYNLPAVVDAITYGDPIYLTEGEKDADALTARGVVATTHTDGAEKWRREYTDLLKGAAIVHLVADDDAPGHRHMLGVASELATVGVAHDVLLPAAGKDAFDHLAAGYGVEDFRPAGDLEELVAAVTPNGDGPATVKQKKQRTIVFRPVSGYLSERVTWVPGFEFFLVRGMVNMLAGLQGLGKSTWAAHVAAAESRAGRYVIFLPGEDSIRHTVRPRLLAAGADVDRVIVPEPKEYLSDGTEFDSAITLPDDGPLLRELVGDLISKLDGEVSTFILDPLNAFLGRAETNSQSEVRPAFAPLQSIAEEFDICMLTIGHINKGSSTNVHRVGGSSAYTEVPRSVMLFGRNPDDPDRELGHQRVLASLKANLSAKPKSRAYDVVGAHVISDDGTPPDIATSKLEPRGESEHQAGDLLAGLDGRSKSTPPKVTEAMEWLAAVLPTSPSAPIPFAELEERAPAGISVKTLRLAFNAMPGESVPLGFQKGRAWRLT